MTALLLFFSTFFLVLALGFQSQNANQGHYRSAFLTSFAIGGGQMLLLKLGPQAELIEIAAFLCGGPLGIVASMLLHRRMFGPGREAPPRTEPVWRDDVHATQDAPPRPASIAQALIAEAAERRASIVLPMRRR